MAKTVIGLIDNLNDAQAVVRELIDAGIGSNDIGFMANQKHDLPGTSALNESEGSGTLAGAGTGAALGGMAGLALALAPLAIPGIGPILAAGPIAAALAGAGLGALAGGLIGSLTNLGVPEEEAHYYAEAVRRGGIVITVAVDKAAQAKTAVAIMRRHEAVDIDQRATEWKKQGWKGRFEAGDQPPAETHLPVVQEPQPLIAHEQAAYGARVYPKRAQRAPRKAGTERRKTA